MTDRAFNFFFHSLNDFHNNDGGTIRMHALVRGFAQHQRVIFNLCEDNEYNGKELENVVLKPDYPRLGKGVKRLMIIACALMPATVVGFLFPTVKASLEKIGSQAGKNDVHIFCEYYDKCLAFLFKSLFPTAIVFVDIHGIAEFEFKFKQGNILTRFKAKIKELLAMLFDRRVHRIVDGIIVLNQEMKNFFSDTKGLLRKKFVIIDDGLSEEYLENRVAALEEDKPIGGDVPRSGCTTILFAGSFKQLGGVPQLVQAFLSIAQKFPTVKLVLVGQGEDYPLCRELAEKSDDGARITFLGRTKYSDLPAIQRTADVIVCPDLKHPYSDMIVHTKFYEALASGCIVIASESNAMRALQYEQRLSVGYTPGNAAELENALCQVLSDLEGYRRVFGFDHHYIFQRFGYPRQVTGGYYQFLDLMHKDK